MHFKALLVGVISSLLFEFPGTVEPKWCTKSVPVMKSVYALKEGQRQVSYYNWLGYVRYKTSPYYYQAVEWKPDWKTQKQCCSGYTEESDTCIPKCSGGCPSNSRCSEPELCECDVGYTPSSHLQAELLCEPVCEKGCPANSSCTQPETCVCHEGYALSGSECFPVCDPRCPAHASCRKPGVCECQKGYAMESNSSACTPQCDKGCSQYAACVQPDKCACLPGYRQLEDGSCAPVCEPACGENSYCQSPLNCVCDFGYQPHTDTASDNSTAAAKLCQPFCSGGCPAFSACTRPNQCTCAPGYTMNEHALLCEPMCWEPCPEHSVCITPDNCLCDDGYRLQKLPGHSLRCAPICAQSCSAYGKCVAPDVCECLSGYELRPEGAETALCQPKCSHDCANGFCFAPETCVCNPGYLMGPNNTCAAVCSFGCINGHCREPEICECDPGYRFANNSVHECEPICTPPCQNADCVLPDVCFCRPQYEPELTNMHHCVPSCSAGHIRNERNPSECIPQCSDCSHGTCLAPGVCQCWPGYELTLPSEGSKEVCTRAVPTSTTSSYDYSTTVDSTLSMTESTIHPWNPPASEEWTASEATDPNSTEQCAPRCKCWQEHDEMGTLQQAKCIHICLDDFDEPCLDLRECVCDSQLLELICNSTADSVEDTDMRYTCRVRVPEPARIVPLQKAHQKETGSHDGWWIALAGIALSLIVAVVGFAAYRRCIAANASGDYVVDFHK